MMRPDRRKAVAASVNESTRETFQSMARNSETNGYSPAPADRWLKSCTGFEATTDIGNM